MPLAATKFGRMSERGKEIRKGIEKKEISLMFFSYDSIA